MPTNYVQALRPLLNRFGNEAGLTLIVFTLDESTYSRELAPLAGHYPCLRLGPAWWFHDSPEGMMRFREYTTETAGFYNTVGFNDDTVRFSRFPRDMMWRVASIAPFLLVWWRSIALMRMKQPRSHRSLPTGWPERLTGFSSGTSFAIRDICTI